jgi:hypothetical protein
MLMFAIPRRICDRRRSINDWQSQTEFTESPPEPARVTERRAR